MGAGKEGGGDGAGKEQAAVPPQPVVLRMVLHCEGCAKKVRKSIHHMPGVVSVATDAAANTVVVAGTADAAALKARIESKTKKPVEIVSAGGTGQNKPPPAEPKKHNPDTEKHKSDKGGGEEQKNHSDKGDKAGASQPQPHPKEEKKQPSEEKKPVQETITPTTAVLRIRLHCDSCADRIRRRIYKIKGVKDVIVEGNGKDEVKVVGTMDVPAMVVYLNQKLNRTVELASSPASKDDGHMKDKSGGDGHVKERAADAHKGDKGKGIEVAGPSMASAAAYMAPATAMANTHHVSPYGYGNVAYPPQQPQQGPPPGYYNSSYYGGGNADGAGYATPYYPQPRGDAGGYYQQQPRGDAGSYYQQQPRSESYYQHQPSADTSGSYYQHPGGYDQPPNPPPYPSYPFDTAPPPQMFSDENPNGCSVM